MAHTNRYWKIMIHNIRGINAPEKWNFVRRRITKTKCDIICLQETKREHFDGAYVQNFSLEITMNLFIYRPLVPLVVSSLFGKVQDSLEN
jgi:hypothetical protein